MYTPKERTHAIMLYQSRLSLRAAAKEIGCTDTTVENWLRIEGIPRRKDRSGRNGYTKAIKRKALQMLDNGMTLGEIQVILKIPRSTIWRWKQKKAAK